MAGDYDRKNRPSNPAPPEPSPYLLEAVMERIEAEKRRAARRRFAVFSLASALSAISFIPAYQFFQAEVSGSGFAQFFSLFFSDPEISLLYWRDLTLLLLELLPIAGFAAILGNLFVFLGSLRLAAQELENAFAVVKTS